MGFRGRHYLVTGAGSGIGQAVSVALAASGARVSLLGRDATKLTATAKLLGDRAVGCFSVDLASAAAITEFVRQFSASDVPLHGLVHAAGDFHRASISEIRPADAIALLTANAGGPLLLTSALLPHLRRTRGDVIFVNSSVARRGGQGVAEYSMSKTALCALADSLRAEENASGLRVTSVYVGRTATPMQEQVARAEGRAYDPERLLQPAHVAATIVAALSLPHSAEVTDIHIRPVMPPI